MRILAALGVLFLLAAAHSPAQQQSTRLRSRSIPFDDTGCFREAEIRQIQDYYRSDGKEAPPGVAKKGEVSAALLQQIRRGRPVPAGLEKHLEPFPTELQRRLLPVEPGFKRWVVGWSALAVKEETGLVVDVVPLRQP
jgi:hypothetical protein